MPHDDRLDTPLIVNAIGHEWDRPGDQSPAVLPDSELWPEERVTITDLHDVPDRLAVVTGGGGILLPHLDGGWLTPAEAVKLAYRLFAASFEVRGVAPPAGLWPTL